MPAFVAHLERLTQRVLLPLKRGRKHCLAAPEQRELLA